MKPRAKKLLVAAAVVYLALWAATRATGVWRLERQLQAEAQRAWERYRGDPQAPKYGSLAHPGGPSVQVEWISCPAPFIFKAGYGRVIGPLNGYGAEGLFFLTPWHVYTLYEVDRWVS